MTALPVDPWNGRTPREWQARTLPLIQAALASGARPCVTAVTGGGKTALLGALSALTPGRVVISVPNRRLVDQTAKGIQGAGRYYTSKKDLDTRITVVCIDSLAKYAALRPNPALLICDEAHATENTQVRDVVPALNPAGLVGFSATPRLADESKTLTLFDSTIEGLNFCEALDAGVLAPWKWIWRRKAGVPIECDPGTEAIDLACIEDMLRECPKGPGLVTSATVLDAIAFAARLTAAGIPAEAISYKDSAKAQTAKLEKLERGELAYLTMVDLLGAGVDLPWLRCIVLRDELGSVVKFVQLCGRGFRCFPGKDCCLLVDPRLYGLRLRLEHDARVGAQELDAALRRAEAKAPPEEPAPVVLSGPVALAATAAWLAQVFAAYERAGYPQSPQAPWRSGHPTKSELAALRKLCTPYRLSHLPAPVREPLRGLLEVADNLTAADVSLLYAIVWSNTRWFDAGAKERVARGGNPYAFVHRPSLLKSLPGELPEGCLLGLREKAPLFQEKRWAPWPGDENREGT